MFTLKGCCEDNNKCVPPEDGAAGAHGVPHGGDALQGQARPVPEAGGRGAAPGSPPHPPRPALHVGWYPGLPSLPAQCSCVFGRDSGIPSLEDNLSLRLGVTVTPG